MTVWKRPAPLTSRVRLGLAGWDAPRPGVGGWAGGGRGTLLPDGASFINLNKEDVNYTC